MSINHTYVIVAPLRCTKRRVNVRCWHEPQKLIRSTRPTHEQINGTSKSRIRVGPAQINDKLCNNKNIMTMKHCSHTFREAIAAIPTHALRDVHLLLAALRIGIDQTHFNDNGNVRERYATASRINGNVELNESKQGEKNV